MSTASEPLSPASEVEVEVEQPARRIAQMRYTRDEVLAVKDHPDCQKLPPGLEPDDLSDLTESVFFDKSTIFDHSSSSGDIYLGPQRGPPPGLRPAFAGPRRTGFAPGPPVLHSRLVDDGRSLSPDRGFPRVPSSGLTSAFAVSPGKVPLPGVRARFDDASKMDRWDSNKLGPGGEPEDWTPRGRAGRVTDWRGGGGEPTPGTPSAAPLLGAPRHSLERAPAAWVGGKEPAVGEPLRRSGSSLPKDQGGRWAKDDSDDWRSRKQTGAAPEPRYDWADRNAAAAGGPPPREPPPGFGHAAPARRGMPEWADDGANAQRGPVTAADIEAERQRMQKQWKDARAARQGVHHEHEEPESHAGADEGPATFLGEVMDDNDFDSWARGEKAKQVKEDHDEEERKKRQAAAPKPGQQIDVRALFGGAGGGPAAPAAPAAPVDKEVPRPMAGGEHGEPGMRSRFANFFKLDEGADAGAQQLQHLQQQHAQQQQQQGAGVDSSGNAGSALLAMLKKQLPDGAPTPGLLRAQQAQQGSGMMAGGEGPGGAQDLDDVAQVAMSAALQGLDEAMGEEERLGKQAPPQQQAQQAQQALPPYMQAQQAQHAAMLAALGSRPMMPQQVQQGMPLQQQGTAGGLQAMLRAAGMQGMQGGLPQGSAPAGYAGQPSPQYSPVHQGMQYGSMQQQAARPQYGAPMQQAPQQQYGYQGMPQYRPPMGAAAAQHAALLQQQAQQVHQAQQAQQAQQVQQAHQVHQAQQNALLAQLLAAQQRQQQAQQAHHMMPGQQAGQINLAALLAAAGGGGGAGNMPSAQAMAQAQAQAQAQIMGQNRAPQMMQPNLGGQAQQGASAQLQFLHQLQMAAAAAGGGGGGGLPPGMAHHQMQQQQQQAQQAQQAAGQTGGGMTAVQQQQLLGMLRMGGRQPQ